MTDGLGPVVLQTASGDGLRPRRGRRVGSCDTRVPTRWPIPPESSYRGHHARRVRRGRSADGGVDVRPVFVAGRSGCRPADGRDAGGTSWDAVGCRLYGVL